MAYPSLLFVMLSPPDNFLRTNMGQDHKGLGEWPVRLDNLTHESTVIKDTFSPFSKKKMYLSRTS